ncbi:ESX secretion-associated protein EspG [Nocardia sp. NPDC058497]|uniref:ESX secretion-associated protein EspG n=1 Tax=Nocardia sp. NPDC058497 TaxID=3346529 RepID=UPI003658C8C6
MSEWTWDPDDFAALWLNDGRDRFPRPLHFTSRFRYREEFDAHGREVRARYTDAESAAIALALNTLATADIRLEVSADNGVEDSGNHTHYRIVGARDLHNAVIAAQTVVNGADGPIWVRRGRPENLGKGIATRIPPCAPGRHRPDEFHIQDLAPDRTNYFTDTARNSPRERYDRLIDRPLAGSGCAALRIGDFHTRDIPRRVIEWFDFESDGRYIHHKNSDRIRIEPGTNSDLQSIMVRWIDNEMHRIYGNHTTGGY